jgi:outer membrane protein assembly factor BamB
MVVEWATDSFEEMGTYREVLMVPVVGQLTDDNGDGLINAADIPDIVSIADEGLGTGHLHGVLRIHDGATGRIHLTLSRIVVGDIDFHPYQYSNVALGDIDNDGLPEIVLVAQAIPNIQPDEPGPPPDTGEEPVRMIDPNKCVVAAFTHEGELDWALMEPQIRCGGHSPALADLEGDGTVEVILGPLVIQGATGELAWELEVGKGTFAAYDDIGFQSFAADLEGDGRMEVITGRSIHESTGEQRCSRLDQMDGFPAVADLDNDTFGDVVTVGGGMVRIMDRNCQDIASFPLVGSGNGGPPTLADMDNDGVVEIGIADADYYAVYEADGTVLWKREITDASSHATGSSVFDFDGNGMSEILYADETALYVFDGRTGVIRYTDPTHTSRTLHEYPVIADVDGDGQAEIVVAHGGNHVTGGAAGLTVLGSANDSWRPARTVWNQHAYSITNIQEDMQIPSPAPVNWPLYNSFRAGTLVNLGHGLLPDAVPLIDGVCMDDCGENQLSVVVRLGNKGTESLPADTRLTLYALRNGSEEVLYTSALSAPVLPGQTSPGVMVPLDSSQTAGAQLHLVADDDGQGAGWVIECNEDNNRSEPLETACE